MKDLKVFIPLWKFIKEEKVKIIFASILLMLSSISSIFTGYLNGGAVEAITKMNLEKTLLFLIIYLAVSLIFGHLFGILGNQILQIIENKMSRKLSYFAYQKALNLPAYAYEKKSSGEIINRITNDAGSMSFTFGQLLDLISSFLSVFIITIYIIFNSWIIALEIGFFLVILYLVLNKYNPLLKKTHKDRKEYNDKFTSLVTETVRGIREIKTLGIKQNLLFGTKDILTTLYKKSNEEIDIRKRFRILNGLIKLFLEVLVFITCAILLYYKQISLTFFIAMTYYVYRYMWLMENINSFSQTYQQLIVALERVNELLENKLFEDEKFGSKEIKEVKGVIEFKDVDFAYPNEKSILNKFNLKLQPNKKIAIVGKSGQGKSTVFNLLTRVFDPANGSILLDGINISELTEDDLRKHISIIRQEPFVFNKSIKENFQLINKKIRLKEIREYAKMAYLDDYIMSLPKKYDTVLGEGGVNLSGGQKQRLSIARTLAKQSKVILLDEATSALDNSSQEYIKKTIDNLVKDHTVVIVAHRLSTIMDADIIHVVDGGKIIASGTHKELMKKCKIYKDLYKTEL